MSDENNPWLTPVAGPAGPAPAVVEKSLVVATGPVYPQSGVPAPDLVDQLPVREQRTTAELWWVGAHGGAGESSLAALVPDWVPAEHAWPKPPGQTAHRAVLVARSHMAGLRAVQAAATQWAAGLVPHVELLGLVVVADAPGRLPRPLREFAKLVGGGVPRTWYVPWVESWRLGEPPALPDAPREVRRLVDDLGVLIKSGAESTTIRKEQP